MLRIAIPLPNEVLIQHCPLLRIGSYHLSETGEGQLRTKDSNTSDEFEKEKPERLSGKDAIHAATHRLSHFQAVAKSAHACMSARRLSNMSLRA